MTLETDAHLAFELRPHPGLVIDRVENCPQLRIDCRDLDGRAPLHPPDVDGVVEVDGARGCGRDVIDLQARLGRNEQLRRDIDVQFAQQRSQISVLLVILELDLASFHAGLEFRYRIRGLGRVVPDRFVLQLHIGLSDGGALHRR